MVIITAQRAMIESTSHDSDPPKKQLNHIDVNHKEY